MFYFNCFVNHSLKTKTISIPINNTNNKTNPIINFLFSLPIKSSNKFSIQLINHQFMGSAGRFNTFRLFNLIRRTLLTQPSSQKVEGDITQNIQFRKSPNTIFHQSEHLVLAQLKYILLLHQELLKSILLMLLDQFVLVENSQHTSLIYFSDFF